MNTNPNTLHQKRKIFQEISFIRSVASLCIVMVHVTAGYYHENGNTFDLFTRFLNQITRYGTPAFAIIGGFLLFNQSINKNFNIRKFIKSRFTKIVIPFLVWSFLYLFLKSLYGLYRFPKLSTKNDILDFLYFFLTGQSNYHLYFICIVIQFYLLFPFIQTIKSKDKIVFFTFIAFFVNYFFVNFNIDIGEGLLNEFINDKVFLLHWIFYFLFGGVLVLFWDRLINWIKKNQNFSLTLGVIIIISGIIEYNLSGWVTSNRSINMINLPFLFIALIGVYHKLSTTNKVRNVIIELGNLSMGIYLVHPMILFFLRTYDYFNFFYNHTLFLPIMYVFVLAISVVIVRLINRLPFGSYIVTIANNNRFKK
ncbi:acyltransferase [Lentibacillus saliphilus]|uniref:acyltransferase n=1 Tax=Lentibacillus saliphilus TaxID=2737028 RepID=UPI001C2F4DC8|nr:acyltransferase [Lentibacillus saliphilus]